MANIKTAIDIAHSAKVHDEKIWAGQMDRLVEDVIKLEKLEFRLTRIELEDGS